ncbi:MAG TPA: PSD1 and planctomycete cytochrome C domain-containing protein [Gemmataceae bacterium]|nr:PSD1 and planctomycete cytochrome C domain-containing protein [Gemmataceae bacterium]
MRLLRTALLGFLFLGHAAVGRADPPVDYLREVKPILAQHCFSCHSAKIHKGKLRLDTAALMRKGGTSGPAIVPGKAGKSLLVHALNGTNDVTQMPYKKPALADKQIRVLAAWIDQGAKAPDNEIADDGTGRHHWAFQAPKRYPLPTVKDAAWVKNPIDYFILARLEREGIRPSPEAERSTLIRRLYLDLLGLPPTIEEVDAFLADRRPGAYERLVDRLLASPHYGERWGRHWLDLARYGDTNGFTIDTPREIWKYRDWVIDALNKDMPFNQFVIEQMAGDMLPGATVEQKIATGFHRNTLFNEEGGIDLEQFRVDAVADRVNTTGTVFLGLTLGCARCHDHKYDPISQKEYFQLFAFLNNQKEPVLNLATPELAAKRATIRAQLAKEEEALDLKLRDYVKNTSEAEKATWMRDITLILNLGFDQRTEKQKRTLAVFFSPREAEFKKRFNQIAALKKQEPKFATTMVLEELAKPRATTIHLGGDFTRKGAKVEAGVPAVLHSLSAKPQASVNRLDLARWLVDAKNPLVGRVTVNRLWQAYFGTGLVETENDFGTQGIPPTHPELLDWLATELPAQGWSLKAMHRLILTSATYRQASKARPELATVDPHNRLLARQNRLRLDAEIVRDNALAVSGLLTQKFGGPSVYPPQPKGIYQFTQVQRSWQTSIGPDRFRRGIYTFFQRSAPYPALTVFDAPDGTSTCTRRIRSNTPLQALTLLNDHAFLELAQGLAERVYQESNNKGHKGHEAEEIRHAFRLCLAREPSPAECKRLEQFLALQLKEYQADSDQALALLLVGQKRDNSVPLPPDLPQRAAWMSLCRVLLNLDEFITRE